LAGAAEAVRVVDPNTGHLGVSYPSLVPLLVEAVKQQQKIIHEQMTTMDSFRVARDAEIAELRSRLERLERLAIRPAERSGE
jgi:hypothetical protein